MSIVFNGHTVAGAPPPSDTANAAKKADLTSIIATGATNATGATITSGTYFYLNGTLAVAKADIASGATFTENTNYEAVTAGGLNSLKSAFATVSGTFSSDNGWSQQVAFPNGFTDSNCVIISFQVFYYDRWRVGSGLASIDMRRTFCSMQNGIGIECYNDEPNLYSAQWKATLMKL